LKKAAQAHTLSHDLKTESLLGVLHWPDFIAALATYIKIKDVSHVSRTESCRSILKEEIIVMTSESDNQLSTLTGARQTMLSWSKVVLSRNSKISQSL